MIVLGHRVLIAPDPQPASQGGIELPQDRQWVSTSGTVVQVGPGRSKLRYDARQRAIEACLEAIAREHGSTNDWFHAGLRAATERIKALEGTVDPECDVQVGDRVAFSPDHGERMTFDGEDYLILNQDDVIVIVSEAEEAA